MPRDSASMRPPPIASDDPEPRTECPIPPTPENIVQTSVISVISVMDVASGSRAFHQNPASPAPILPPPIASDGPDPRTEFTPVRPGQRKHCSNQRHQRHGCGERQPHFARTRLRPRQPSRRQLPATVQNPMPSAPYPHSRKHRSNQRHVRHVRHGRTGRRRDLASNLFTPQGVIELRREGAPAAGDDVAGRVFRPVNRAANRQSAFSSVLLLASHFSLLTHDLAVRPHARGAASARKLCRTGSGDPWHGRPRP